MAQKRVLLSSDYERSLEDCLSWRWLCYIVQQDELWPFKMGEWKEMKHHPLRLH